MWNEAANPVIQVLPNSWGGLPPRPDHSQHRVSSSCFTTKRSRSTTLPETAFRSRVGHSSRPRRPRKISSQFVAFDVSDSRQRNVLNWRSDFLLFVRTSTFFDLENWSPTSCTIAAFERCLQSDRRSARFRILQDSGRVKSDDTSLGKNPIRGILPDRGSQAKDEGRIEETLSGQLIDVARHPLLAKRGEGRGEELEFFRQPASFP